MHLNDKIYNEMFMQNFNTLCIHTKFQKSGLLLKWVLILHNALRVLKLLQNAENNKKNLCVHISMMIWSRYFCFLKRCNKIVSGSLLFTWINSQLYVTKRLRKLFILDTVIKFMLFCGIIFSK